MSIILGYSTSRFEIIEPGGRLTTVNLPLTNLNGGLVENYEVKKLEHELITLDGTFDIEIAQQIFGYRVFFDFSFQDWAAGETLMSFKQIITGAKAGHTLRLYPRTDQNWRWFIVIFKSDNFSVGLGKGGSKAWIHKLFNAQFVTKSLEQSLKWEIVIPPDLRNYSYGCDGYSQITLTV